jgi:HK97 family phage major capsid protein/HK97 family phage prohead protease
MSVIHKTVAGGGDGLKFVLSDDTVDRYGDIVDPKGWVLANFKKNPIALFGHSSSFPIGTWSDVKVEGNKLVAFLNFAARGTSARIDELISLVEQGILRAVSVGFRPLQSEPIDKDKPYAGQRYTKQELLETSLVSVPANPAAVALAKSLNLSSETMSLVFGEHADVKRRDVSASGEHAETTTVNQDRARAGHAPLQKKDIAMKTLAQRIEDAQSDLNVKRDHLAELNGAEELDLDAIEGATEALTLAERTLSVLKASEAKIGVGAVSKSGTVPAEARRPLGLGKDISGFDILVKAVAAHGIAHFGNKSVDQVLSERYNGQDAVAMIAKADQTVGTTTVSGWASEIVQTVNADFIQALTPYSIYPALRSRGIGLSFDGIGTVSIPSRTIGGAGGGFVAEGQPIRVGRITTAATTMTPKKLGVIVPFTRELAKRSTPAVEALVRQAILEDTSIILDQAILDATASSSARPAGLLNGVSAVATGYGGGDYQAVVADLKALLAPFYNANAGDNITVLMNPAQGLALSMMPGPGAAGEFGWAEPLTSRLNIVESTNVTAGRLIALRNSDFATALGDAPEFDISEQATVHMEDTTPLEIVSGTPTVADPVRSFFQTATIGVRMLMDVSWKMRRSGMVQWIDGTSW